MTSPRNFGRLNLGSLGFAETSRKDRVGTVRVRLEPSWELVKTAASIFRLDSKFCRGCFGFFNFSLNFVNYTEGYNFAVEVREHLHLLYQLFADGLQTRNPLIVKFKV